LGAQRQRWRQPCNRGRIKRMRAKTLVHCLISARVSLPWLRQFERPVIRHSPSRSATTVVTTVLRLMVFAAGRLRSNVILWFTELGHGC
jgi:hypothetical protein